MIFKVFDSDIDKWTAKIGVFGKSFNELGVAIENAFVNASLKNNKTFGGSLKSFFGSLKSDLSTPKAQMINVDAIYPKIDHDTFDFKTWLKDLSDVDKGVRAGATTWQDYSDSLEENQRWIAQWGQQTEGTIRTQQDMIRANVDMRHAALAQNEAIKQQSFSYKALSVSMKLASMAGNMIAGIIVAKAIQFVIKEINETVNATKIAKEAAEEYGEELKTLQKTQSDNTKTISELESEYKKLSSGVDNLGNNVSLTTDEYDRYHEITNQIADIMPNLVQGFDEQGNAILKLKGNLVDLNNEYAKYKQNEAIESYNEKNEDGDFKRESIFENAENKYKGERKNNFFSPTEELEYLKILSKLNLDGLKEMVMSDVTDATSSSLQFLSGKYYFKHFDSLDDTNFEDFEKVRADIESRIGELESDVNSALIQLVQLGLKYAQTTNGYYELDGNQQSYLSSILNNLSADFVNKNQLFNEDNLENFVRQLTTGLQNADVQEAMSHLYDVDTKELALEDINEYIDTIAALLGVDSDILSSAFGFDYAGEVQNVKAILSDSDEDKINSLSIDDLQFASSLKVPEGVTLSWDELIEKIEKAKEASGYYEPPSFESVVTGVKQLSEGFEQLDTIYADLLNGEDFDYGNFLDNETFKQTFGSLTNVTDEYKNAYNEFIQELSNSNGKLTSDVQSAFNNLATAYIENETALDSVTEATRESIIAQLEQMGVANAKQVVDSYLELGKIKDEIVSAGYDLVNITNTEAMQFMNLSTASDTAKKYLFAYQVQKAQVNNNPIDTIDECNQLYALAGAAGYTGSALIYLAKIKSLVNKIESEELVEGTLGYTDVMSQITQYNGLLQKVISSEVKAKEVTVDFAGGTNSLAAAQKNLGSAADDAKDAYKDVFDFFERRVKVLEDAFANLETGIENVLGAEAKNTLLSQQLGILDEEVNNYTDALDMYQEKANNALSKLDSDIQNKIVNGEVSLIDFDNEEVVEAMKDYEGWADKVAECTQKLQELEKQIRELELEKFNNIIKDFTDQFDLRETAKNNIDAQIGLLEESGEVIGEAYYQQQISQSQEQLKILESQKNAMVKQMTDALNSGRIQKGTDEWLEMATALQEIDGSILDCKTSIEEFENSILELDWSNFERVQTALDGISTELSNLATLFDDANEIAVSDGNGNWTEKTIATLGLHAQEYENAKLRVQQYSDAIAKLEEDYKTGKYSSTEYMDKLAELTQGQWDSVNAMHSAEDAIISLNETRVNESIETLNEELEAYKKLIDAQIELIDETEKLKDKQEDLAEKSKSVSDIEKQLAAIMYDNSAAGIAKRKLLEEELSEAKKDLADAEHDYAIEAQKDALNKQYEDKEESINSEIEQLEETLKDRETLLAQSFDTVKQNATLVGEQILLIAQEHGVKVSNEVITPWANGEKAIASYGEVLTTQSSVFINTLMGVEAEIYKLQTDANIASQAIAYMFSNRADTLVSELTASYSSIENLNNVTSILKQNMIDTLERGYDISSIVDGLNSIADAANSTADAFRDMYAAANTGGSSTPLYGKGNPYQSATDHAQKIDKAYNQGNIGKYYIVDNTTGNIIDSGLTKEEALRKYRGSSEKGHRYKIQAYAKGSKYIDDDQLAWTDEHGNKEMIIRRSDGAILTRLERGDAIANANLAENLFKWGEINPNRFMDGLNMTGFKIDVPMNESRGNVTLHYDKMFEFNGDFNNSEQLLNQMKNVASKATTKILNDINRDYKARH